MQNSLRLHCTTICKYVYTCVNQEFFRGRGSEGYLSFWGGPRHFDHMNLRNLIFPVEKLHPPPRIRALFIYVGFLLITIYYTMGYFSWIRNRTLVSDISQLDVSITCITCQSLISPYNFVYCVNQAQLPWILNRTDASAACRLVIS